MISISLTAHRFGTNSLQDYVYLITPNIWPLNKKYKDYKAPFYGLNDRVPILLTLLLGLQPVSYTHL